MDEEITPEQVPDAGFLIVMNFLLLGTSMMFWSTLFVLVLSFRVLKEHTPRSVFGHWNVLVVQILFTLTGTVLQAVIAWFWVFQSLVNDHEVTAAYPKLSAAIPIVETAATILTQAAYFYSLGKKLSKAKVAMAFFFTLGVLGQTFAANYARIRFLQQDYSLFDESRLLVLIPLPATMLAMDLIMLVIFLYLKKSQREAFSALEADTRFWNVWLQVFAIFIFATSILLISIVPSMSFLLFYSLHSSLRVGAYLGFDSHRYRSLEEKMIIEKEKEILDPATSSPLPLNHQSFMTCIAWLERTNGDTGELKINNGELSNLSIR